MKILLTIIKKWISNNSDKLAHFIICALLMTTFTPMVGPYWAALITIIIGIIKEVFDKFNGGRFDWLDLLADSLGIIYIIGYTLIL